MKSLSEEQRQLAGCGFAPPPRDALLPFVAPWSGLGYSGAKPTVCPGYSTSLPETIEIARGRLHWSKGGPAAIGVADWASSPLTIGIEILEGACNEAERWSFDNPVKK